MCYVYSLGLCDEALRIMKSNDSLDNRLVRAFGEMGVSKFGDTSDAIWNKWKILQQRYHIVSGEIYKLRQEGVDIPDAPQELIEFGDALYSLVSEWKEFNNSKKPNKKRIPIAKCA